MSGDESKGFRSWTNDDLVKRAQEKWGFTQDEAGKLKGRWVGQDLEQKENDLKRWFKLVLKDDQDAVDLNWGRIRGDLLRLPGHPLNTSTTQSGAGDSQGGGDQQFAQLQKELRDLNANVTRWQKELRALNANVTRWQKELRVINANVERVFSNVDRRLSRVEGNVVGSLVTNAKMWGERLEKECRLDVSLSETKYTQGPSVLTEKQQQEVAQAVNNHDGPKEKRMTELLYNHLRELFERDDVWFGNSEDYGWLPLRPQLPQKLKWNESAKPDNFWVHKSFFWLANDEKVGGEVKRGRPIVCNSRRQLYRKVLPFVGTAEAKVQLSYEGLGEECDYIHRQLRNADDFGRGLVYDVTSFWLIEYKMNTLIQRIRGKWTDAGSVAAIVNFFKDEPVPIRVLRRMCKLFHVDPVRGGFLGHGGYGFVFRVVDSKGVERALKIVCRKNAVSLLEGEARGLKHAGAEIAIQPVDLGIHDNPSGPKPIPNEDKEANVEDNRDRNDPLVGEGYAGLLLEVVGTPVEVPRDLPAMVNLLCELHKKGRCHGDARVVNFVRVESRVRLIDFLENPAGTAAQDMQLLLKSALGEPLAEPITAAVSRYDGSSTNDITFCLRNVGLTSRQRK